MPVLTVTSTDPILHVVAPISLAAAADTAVLIDRDPANGWPFPVGSLGDLAASGPTARDLHPTKSGVALLGGPAVDGPAVDALIDALQSTWPAVVIRSGDARPPAIRIEPALPWRLPSDLTVDTGVSRSADADIPAPPIRLLRRIIRGEIDPRWRWIRHWRPVWEQAR